MESYLRREKGRQKRNKQAKTKDMTPTKKQPTQADCAYIKNGVMYSSYNGKKIGRVSK